MVPNTPARAGGTQDSVGNAVVIGVLVTRKLAGLEMRRQQSIPCKWAPAILQGFID
jgi:hypothetical protein